MTDEKGSFLVTLLSDSYTRKARLYPALFLLAPVALCVLSVVSVELSYAKTIAVILAACGGTYFLAQIARDSGKRKESSLFQKWGGPPSVAILRFRDTRIDDITKARYHRALARVVKGTKKISRETEITQPEEADKTYTAWSHYLRASTRDKARYSLIFEELTSYGYRRNMWGLRPYGVTVSLACAVAAIGVTLNQYRLRSLVEPRVAVADVVAIGFLLLWLLRISEHWVRLAADAYAQRLVEAADSLGSDDV